MIFRAIFGNRLSNGAASALPAELATAIASSTVLDRGDVESPRIIVMVAGMGGFVFADASARQWLEKSFPGLTPMQTGRALALIQQHVAERQHSAVRDSQRSQGDAWRAWKPLRDQLGA